MSENTLPTLQEARDALASINDLAAQERIARSRVFASVDRVPDRENKSRMEVRSWVNDSFIASISCEFGSMSHRLSRKAAYELVERLSARLQETATDEAVQP